MSFCSCCHMCSNMNSKNNDIQSNIDNLSNINNLSLCVKSLTIIKNFFINYGIFILGLIQYITAIYIILLGYNCDNIMYYILFSSLCHIFLSSLLNSNEDNFCVIYLIFISCISIIVLNSLALNILINSCKTYEIVTYITAFIISVWIITIVYVIPQLLCKRYSNMSIICENRRPRTRNTNDDVEIITP